MNIRRAGLFGSAAIVVVVLALAPSSALAYNSNNHGHHYGQLKHQQAPPPNPPPPVGNSQQTVTGPSVAVHHLIATVAGQSRAGIVAPPVFLPVPVIISAPRPTGDGVSWLVLLILPSLVAVWVMVFARAAVRMSRRMRASMAAA